jgi:hypothetical protein
VPRANFYFVPERPCRSTESSFNSLHASWKLAISFVCGRLIHTSFITNAHVIARDQLIQVIWERRVGGRAESRVNSNHDNVECELPLSVPHWFSKTVVWGLSILNDTVTCFPWCVVTCHVDQA